MHWASIPSFPGYSVSDKGWVKNDSERVLSNRINPSGVTYVGLTRDGKQFNRSLAKLVAEAFLPQPMLETFDTPINLDGDRTRCDVTNLMWRPRWFAMKYQYQFTKIWSEGYGVIDVESGLKYQSAMHAATTHGLLALDVYEWAIMYRYYIERKVRGVWPTGQRFSLVDTITRGKRSM